VRKISYVAINKGEFTEKIFTQSRDGRVLLKSQLVNSCVILI